jgi:ketosteroid isomerase-like protein
MNKLPHAIASYIDAANAGDGKRLAAGFTPDASVFDEGHVRRGREEIAAWAGDTAKRYQSVIDPVALTEAGDEVQLRATVRGNFPGSPITLRFHFQLQSGHIQSLEIKP